MNQIDAAFITSRILDKYEVDELLELVALAQVERRSVQDRLNNLNDSLQKMENLINSLSIES